MDSPMSNALGGTGMGMPGRSMTLDELSTIPLIGCTDGAGLNMNELQIKTSLSRNDGSVLDGTTGGGSAQSTPPVSGTIERRDPSISDGMNRNVTLPNLLMGMVDATQSREPLDRPGDPSLDVSEKVEGPTLNVNQEATGPK